MDVVVFEQDGHLLRRKEGKEGESFSFSSTLNCGDAAGVAKEIEKLVTEYQAKGYVLLDESTQLNIAEAKVFDKAKWHLNDQFPAELVVYQAYVHTGFYLGWLIKNDLVSDSFRQEHVSAIRRLLNKEITSVKFYEDQLDGVFTSEDLNEKGLRFTEYYFDFQNGQYLKDYESVLVGDLDTFFHVEDTWGNFEKINLVIDQRYREWLG